MQYLLLIYGDEQAGTDATPDEMKQLMDDYWAYGDWLKGQGWDRGGEALQPTAQATTVRVRDGKPVTTDGPFAETREQLGGYFLIDAKDLDEAIGVAKRIPAARLGTVEVRPVLEVAGLPNT